MNGKQGAFVELRICGLLLVGVFVAIAAPFHPAWGQSETQPQSGAQTPANPPMQASAQPQPGPAGTQFTLGLDGGAIVSLRAAHDTVPDTDYIAAGGRLGDAAVRFRPAGGEWRIASTSQLAATDATELSTSEDGKSYGATYTIAGEDGASALVIRTQFKFEDEKVRWNLSLVNPTERPIEISDLSLPLAINRNYGATGRGGGGGGGRGGVILKHSFISGDGSFLFWMRQNSVGPYLTLVPDENTHFEFWDQQGVTLGGGARGGGRRGRGGNDAAAAAQPAQAGQAATGEQPAGDAGRGGRGERRGGGRAGGGQRAGGGGGRGRGAYSLYIHSANAGEVARGRGTKWRIPQSARSLAPKGAAGDSVTYGYTLRWADDYDGVRDALVEENLIDVQVVPGMTVPTDLFAQFALRTKQPIHAIDAEYPDATRMEALGKSGDYQIYKVNFARLGENRLTVRFGDDRQTYLEFFVTEPLETLIKKRAAFIAKSQHRDPAKWYNGLITDWNMRDHVLPSPDNYDLISGFRIYAVTCDDPGLAKPAYLASKLAEFPVQSEVEALDYYIQHFVWGGLQRTTDETHAYGIYGIPDWKRNRDSDDEGPDGQLHLWRCYDYPHIIVMYYQMYRLAKHHPQIETKLSAAEYLKRAHGTAMAFFTVPWEIRRWSPYNTGFYNELVIVELLAALEENGLREEADALRGHWERKVNSFASGQRNLFQSEYAFDSTGFESTHALAKYALEHADQLAAGNENFTRERAERFMDAQMAANIFCRGWVEPAYYYLGSDYRGGAGNGYVLTYMSQMGGWSVLDYGLNFAKEPDPYLRLGYASYLSAWALMNTGTPESNYGYWFPGPENDGGAGGGFEPSAYGQTWLGQPHSRGSWLYSCEIDLGYCGALRMAATVLTDDDIFGRACFGGDWRATFDGIEITPKDGLRRRFYAVLESGALQLTLDNDRFAAGPSIRVKNDLSQINFALESDNPAAHKARLRLAGAAAGRYTVRNGAGDTVATLEVPSVGAVREASAEIDVPAGGGSKLFTIARTASTP
jgi:hypothetical protein